MRNCELLRSRHYLENGRRQCNINVTNRKSGETGRGKKRHCKQRLGQICKCLEYHCQKIMRKQWRSKSITLDVCVCVCLYVFIIGMAVLCSIDWTKECLKLKIEDNIFKN